MADTFVVVCSLVSELFCFEIVRIVQQSLTFNFLEELHLLFRHSRLALVVVIEIDKVLQVLRSRTAVCAPAAMSVFVNFVYLLELLTHFGLL